VPVLNALHVAQSDAKALCRFLLGPPERLSQLGDAAADSLDKIF
jgi:hypothetical protein